MIAVTPHSVVFNFDIRESLSPWGSPKYKGKPTRSKQYLAFAAKFFRGCCVCGQPFQLDHAVAGRSRNSRCSDFLVFPNCAIHHIGRAKISVFEKEHGVDIAKQYIEPCLKAYAAHLNVTGSFGTFEEFELALIKRRKTVEESGLMLETNRLINNGRLLRVVADDISVDIDSVEMDLFYSQIYIGRGIGSGLQCNACVEDLFEAEYEEMNTLCATIAESALRLREIDLAIKNNPVFQAHIAK